MKKCTKKQPPVFDIDVWKTIRTDAEYRAAYFQELVRRPRAVQSALLKGKVLREFRQLRKSIRPKFSDEEIVAEIKDARKNDIG